jgi:peroxiredoxin
MRPFALAMLGMAGVLAAASVWMAMQRPRMSANAVNLADSPRHPVSQDMRELSDSLVGRDAPDLELESPAGGKLRLSGYWAKAPTVLVFTKDGCPCSLESQPFFNELASAYAGRAFFVGMIDAGKTEAGKFADDLGVPYPVLPVPGAEEFRRYEAERSVYVTLVSKGGKVLRQWPGYSRSMLVELDEALARACGGDPASLDVSMAPENATSGCRLFGAVGD